MSTKMTSMAEPDGGRDPLGPVLAARIRREREARGWSVAALAAASNVSRAMIGKIERAEASPTAALLGRLSGAFGLTVSTLLAFAEPANARWVSRVAEQGVWTDPQTEYVRRALSPPGADPEMVLIQLPPGAEVPYPASSYAFLRGQSVWVLSGRLVVREGAEDLALGAGDLLAFDLSSPRACVFRNPSAARPVRYVVALVRR